MSYGPFDDHAGLREGRREGRHDMLWGVLFGLVIWFGLFGLAWWWGGAVQAFLTPMVVAP